MGMNSRWFRDIFRDAVWETKGLSADEKAILETYARHARTEDGRKAADADLAWVTYERIMEVSGVGRRARIASVLRSLVDKGWMKAVREAARHSTLYRLTIPTGSSQDGTTEDTDDDAPVVPGMELPSTTEPPAVVPFSGAGSSTLEPEPPASSSVQGTRPLEELPSSRPLPPDRGSAHSIVVDSTGATDDEAEWVLEALRTRARGTIRDLAAYVRATDPGDIADLLAARRAAEAERLARLAEVEEHRARVIRQRAAYDRRAAAAAAIDDARRARTREMFMEAKLAAQRAPAGTAEISA